MKIMRLLIFALLLLVEVYSQQTYPYVSFISQTLANNSYLDITTVGDSITGSVQCNTELTKCCGPAQGSHRGDWYFPNGDRLPFSGSSDIYEYRDAQRVELRRRNNANSPTGIYRCGIPTNAVHHPTDISVRDTVYVGLYTSSGGDITISGDVMYDSDQMTLTCISTGGPATTVTWTRDSTILTEGTETVLNNPVTAQYTHTLNVSTAGEYTCNVSNNKPSSAAASITIPGDEKDRENENDTNSCGSSSAGTEALSGVLVVVIVSGGVVIVGLVAMIVSLRHRLTTTEQKYLAIQLQRNRESTRKEKSGTVAAKDEDDSYEPIIS